MRVLLLLLIISLTGCTDHGLLVPGKPVEPYAIPNVTVTDVAKDAPDVAKLLRDLGIQNVKLEEAVKVQKELLAQRAAIAETTDRLRAQLEIEKGKAQNMIDIDTAAANTADAIKRAIAAHDLEMQTYAAESERRVVMLTAIVGIALLVGGAAWAFFTKNVPVGGAVAGLGLLMIIMAPQIIPLGFPVRIFICVVLFLIAGGIAVAVAMRLRIKWKTDVAAENARVQAMELAAVGKPIEAALAMEKSRALEHVGTVGFDETRVEPSSMALKLAEMPVKEAA